MKKAFPETGRAFFVIHGYGSKRIGSRPESRL